MPTTIGFSFGDVVLVPFPFTDQARRPPLSRRGRTPGRAHQQRAIDEELYRLVPG